MRLGAAWWCHDSIEEPFLSPTAVMIDWTGAAGHVLRCPDGRPRRAAR
jgi:hypothetical protein